MEYNTEREDLKIREYGRHIQKLVDFAVKEKDKKKRQDIVEHTIELMGFLNPQLKTEADYKHKLWDHLYYISNFELDCDSPYPKPEPEELFKKPEKFEYPRQRGKYRHYGKNIESMIEKCINLDEEEKKQAFKELIARFMKRTYSTYNKDGVNDTIIKQDLKRMSDGELTLSEEATIATIKVNQSRRRQGAKGRHSNKRGKNQQRNRNQRRR